MDKVIQNFVNLHGMDADLITGSGRTYNGVDHDPADWGYRHQIGFDSDTVYGRDDGKYGRKVVIARFNGERLLVEADQISEKVLHWIELVDADLDLGDEELLEATQGPPWTVTAGTISRDLDGGTQTIYKLAGKHWMYEYSNANEELFTELIPALFRAEYDAGKRAVLCHL